MPGRWLHITLMLIWTVVPAAAQSLSERIAAATPGATVHVEKGIYTEPTLVIDRPLTLIAEEGAIIRGKGNHELVVIEADSVTIQGFRFEHVGRTFMEDRAAVRVAGKSDCRILDNSFEDVFFGIYLAKANRCEISGNTLRAQFENETSGGNAIHSWYSRNLLVSRNNVDGFRDGIYLEFTEDSRVTENESHQNLRYGLHFMFSDRCAYEDNVFEDNRAGVAVMYADGILMRGNIFRRAWGTSAYGLLLKEIRDGELSGNRFEGNTTGVFMEASDRLDVFRNAFVDNGWALRIMGNAIQNRFQDNDFVGNTFDVSTNSRSAPSSFAGNYWDRYAGYDLDRDGTGDTFYRPVRLFSVLAERHEASLFLYRSILVDVLNAAEDLLPVLTPTDLKDAAPRMQPVSGIFSAANPPSQP